MNSKISRNVRILLVAGFGAAVCLQGVSLAQASSDQGMSHDGTKMGDGSSHMGMAHDKGMKHDGMGMAHDKAMKHEAMKRDGMKHAGTKTKDGGMPHGDAMSQDGGMAHAGG